MKVVLATDHRGFQLKESLKKYLVAQGYDVEDAGAYDVDPQDDYPDFAYAGAQKVAADSDGRGIFICGSAMGMSVVANKVKGIRASVAYSKDSAVHARANDNINVITLASDVLTDAEAQEMASEFLKTPFSSSKEAYSRRYQKILKIEEEHLH